MAVAIATSAINRSAGNQGSLTCSNKPTGVAADDLLILCCFVDQTSSVWGTDPSGWTVRLENNFSDMGIAVYTRIASGDSGDDDPVVDINNNTDDILVWYLRITGHHATTYWDVLGTVDESSSSSDPADSPSVTTTTANCLAFALHGMNGADGYTRTCSGTGWGSTPDLDGRNPDTPATGVGVSAAIITKLVTGAEASNAVSWTPSATDWESGVQFAIAPAAGASNTTIEVPNGPLW